MPALLCCYFLVSLVYAFVCGRLGHSYAALAGYQSYAIACSAALLPALIGGRLAGVWRWRKLWPPSPTATRAALASVVIMTASTLSLLSPSSLLAVVASKAGCLLLVAQVSPISALALPGLAMVAVVLAAATKPPTAAALPLAFAALYVLGYWLKLGAVARSKEVERPGDFLAAEQVLVALGSLAVAAVMSHFAPPAPMTDWRIWVVGGASLAAGLLGTALMLRRELPAITFPAYKAAGLLAALGASAARGELRWAWKCWPSIAAAGLALLVVIVAASSSRPVKR